MSKNDTVNRKQAIDAFYPIRCKLQMMDDTQTADKMLHGLWLAEKAINALPSAQTEIIRCKDCKWYELPSHRITENCVKWWKNNGVLLPIKPTDFCSYGERREDD